MKLIQHLTLRHIVSNKKRTVLTLLAIAVSTAMVTAVFTTFYSFFCFMRDYTRATDGDWQAQFYFSQAPALSAFAQDETVAAYSAARPVTERAGFDPEATLSRAFGRIDAHDSNVSALRSLVILQGMLPKTANELLVNADYLTVNHLSWQPGDLVTLWLEPEDEASPPVPQRFTVTGIAQGGLSVLSNRLGLIGYDATLPLDEETYVTVQMRTVDNGIYQRISALSARVGAESFRLNNDNLNYSGKVTKNNETLATFGGFAAVLLAVIVAASVTMIHDSFSVSYQARARYLGMLASVGATKRQKRSSIYFEGFLLGVIAVPAGMAAGLLGMVITFRAIESAFRSLLAAPGYGTLRVHLHPLLLAGIALLSALTIGLSCRAPARKASKTSAIDAIREADAVQVKPSVRRRRAGRIACRRSFIHVLAAKNFRRNKRRRRTIVFALAVSVILSLSVMNFSAMLRSYFDAQVGETTENLVVLANDRQSLERLTAFLEGKATLRPPQALEEDAWMLGVYTRDPDGLQQALFDEIAAQHLHGEVLLPGAGLRAVRTILSIVRVFLVGFIVLITLIAALNIVNTIANSMNERRREFAMLRSVGMTSRAFRRMVYAESLRYGLHALLWALPVSAGIHGLLYLALTKSETVTLRFTLYPHYALLAAVAVFAVIFLSLLWTADQMQGDQIMDALKRDA